MDVTNDKIGDHVHAVVKEARCANKNYLIFLLLFFLVAFKKIAADDRKPALLKVTGE
ncbi:MAG TPA: hypothetical protein VNY51_10910 [Candidatus Dormibacteraeota bacterium]|jgi:hypothetical protein|nr:hypothetical protein [Candidatus Dormibacteraeota bacterium]